MSGSSPLTRGKPIERFQDVFQDGLIPAHAGKTQNEPGSNETMAAHPRSRGENAIASALATFVAGSSPLTRGKQIAGYLAGNDLGLIPAHAGKTVVCGDS